MASRNVITGWLGLSALALSACSSSTPTPTAAQACADYATAICNLYQSCSSGWSITEQFGDLATCTAQYTANCEARLALESGQSADRVDLCAKALPEYACAALYGNSLPDPCNPPAGASASGAACAIDAQCASAYCAVDKTRLCGTCAEPPGAGADCSSLACSNGLICLHASQTCSAPIADGGACAIDSDCEFGLACLTPFGDAGFCTPEAASGSACDPARLTGLACPNRQGLFCERSSPDAGSCEPFGPAAGGQSCGNVSGVSAVCTASGLCQKTLPDAGEGTCLASATDSQACDIDAGPACLDLSRCVLRGDAGTAGTCRYAGSGSCE